MIKVFTSPFLPENGQFDTHEMDEWTAKNKSDVLHLFNFCENHIQYLTIVVSNNKTSLKTDSGLNGAQKELFEKLKIWRKDQAAEEGIPPFSVFTNAELCNIIQTAPRSLDDVLKIKGIGELKHKKYAQCLLDILS